MNLQVTPTIKSSSTADKWKTRTHQTRLLTHYILNTLPRVNKLLRQWENEAGKCPDPELKKQALASLQTKAFHCQGGSFFAVPYGQWEPLLLELIVAYQTLCDYLDNLCDRAHCNDGDAFLQLHQSLKDGLTPDGPLHDYYIEFPFTDDGGYIIHLVEKCRSCVNQLPSYDKVYADINTMVDRYISLQVYKHISWETREETLIQWANSLLQDYPDILWQEFAAASGSTLAVFALFGLAVNPEIGIKESHKTVNTYFPWICGLHILLDYFIDQEEDRIGEDLNFTFYYPAPGTLMERLRLFINRAHHETTALPNPAFTVTVIEGLLAMYLSDSKIKKLGLQNHARHLISESGGGTMNTFRLCSLVRKFL